MIAKHPTWTLCIVTNLSLSPQQLIASRLGKEKRVFIIACWHPLGVPDRIEGWDTFKKHLLMLKEAQIPLHVLYLWYAPQIKWFPEYFYWLDQNDIRVGVRRYVGNYGGHKIPALKFVGRQVRRITGKQWFMHDCIGGKNYPEAYNGVERKFIDAITTQEVIDYGIDCKSTYGRTCTASKDMILIEYDGTVGLCADAHSYHIGNIFDETFKLADKPIKCPITICGGDYGMLHLQDDSYGKLPEHLWKDTFVSQIENVPQTSPVAYPKRMEMLKWLEELKRQNSQS
jgi:hypothetical protein